MTLAHYKSRMKLKQTGEKYNAEIIETDEYMTTKTYFNCKKINSIGKEKI